MNISKSAFLIAIILAWITLWMSTSDMPLADGYIQQYLDNPGDYSMPIRASAGWPFTVFYYPIAPLGNDIPPDGSVFPFALNATIFFIISWIVLALLPKEWRPVKVEKALILAALVINTLGLLHTILAFD